jgi:hypothetical protein
MTKSLIEAFISDKRFSSYESIDEYERNLQFSKYSYVPLSILEISLRNAIDKHFSKKIGEDWYKDENFLTKDSIFKINQAKDLLQRRRESTSKHKIIAELSLGFWVNLFKKPYDKKLRINDLKNIFPNHPPKSVKLINRDTLYKELNHIRNFRYRVFHYEKVLNKDNYNIIFNEIDEILRYFDDEVYAFSCKINSTEEQKSFGDS